MTTMTVPITSSPRATGRSIAAIVRLPARADHDRPTDLDDAKNPQKRGSGWLLDDQRPTLTLTYPRVGVNEPLKRILVGMYDYGTGIDPVCLHPAVSACREQGRRNQCDHRAHRAERDARAEGPPAVGPNRGRVEMRAFG